MKIIIIGSGNIAFHLAKALREQYINVVQVFGRNEVSLSEISKQTGIAYSTTKIDDADLYLICVGDAAIPSVSRLIPKNNCLVAHTSGSLPTEILEGNYRKACFYPMQTFSKGRTLKYNEIPFFIDTEHDSDASVLENLAGKISSKVMRINYEQRQYLHLTAVFTCNFVNHLFAQGKEIADEQNIPFEYFLPLITETTEKIYTMSPRLAQTGPAVRNDTDILKLHENLITNNLQKEIYTIMNASIQKMYGLDKEEPS